jgi:hypothetical protein
MSSPVPLATVLRKINAHRQAVRECADMKVQATWDAIEDYAMRLAKAGCDVEKKGPRREPGAG